MHNTELKLHLLLSQVAPAPFCVLVCRRLVVRVYLNAPRQPRSQQVGVQEAGCETQGCGGSFELLFVLGVFFVVVVVFFGRWIVFRPKTCR